jgi:hypothetical protein
LRATKAYSNFNTLWGSYKNESFKSALYSVSRSMEMLVKIPTLLYF